MSTRISNSAVWLVSGAWWGLSLGLLLGGWPALLALPALAFGACMAAVEATRSYAPDPRLARAALRASPSAPPPQVPSS
jgi:hypothetical protein